MVIRKLNSLFKLSLLLNIVLIGMMFWLAQKSPRLSNSDSAKEEAAQTQTVCDIAVQEIQKTDLEVFTGKPASVNFDTNPDAKLFSTAITSQVEEGVNFAGHYTVATWGCGTECQGYAIIDVISGKIIEYIPYQPLRADWGLTYSATSNILVFNPRPKVPGNMTAAEVLEDNFGATKGRVYYLLLEENNSDEPYLTTLCVENLYSGLIK